MRYVLLRVTCHEIVSIPPSPFAAVLRISPSGGVIPQRLLLLSRGLPCAMSLKSLRFAGIPDDLADEVGLYDVLTLDLEDVGVDPNAGSSDGGMVMPVSLEAIEVPEEVEKPAPVTPPLAFTSSARAPIDPPPVPVSGDAIVAATGDTIDNYPIQSTSHVAAAAGPPASSITQLARCLQCA